MIITITGKPCSGKGTVSKLFCDKHNFEYLCTGDMFRKISLEQSKDITSIQETEDVKNIDKQVDTYIENLGKARLTDNIVIDSRLAWHFIPKSFKVFIDVDWQTAGERLVQANRESEQYSNKDEAIKALKHRWQIENDRYMELYSVNNLNPEQYDLYINSENKTPEEICDIIYKAYSKQ